MPKHVLATEIEIAASPERVWSVLTDFAAYPAWNPLIPAISGDVTEGSNLRVKLSPRLDGRGVTIKPRLVAVRPQRELRWKGRLPIPGLFAGEHSFRIEATKDGVRFFHGETFRGALIPLLRRLLDGSTRRGFEALNTALKRRAEQS